MNNRQRKQSLYITRNPVYSWAIQNLNDALEQNTEHPNVEKIQLLRIALFGDLALQTDSEVVTIPNQ